jgi:hypothetical protein
MGVGVSFRVFVEIFEWRIKIVGHRNQPFSAAKLRNGFRSRNWHEPNDMLVVFGNENFVTTNSRFNQIGQSSLGLFNAYLMHAVLPRGKTITHPPIAVPSSTYTYSFLKVIAIDLRDLDGSM